MEDFLDAASLMFAVIGILYGSWYPEMSAALRVQRPRHLADAWSERKQVSDAARAKGYPLTAASILVAAIVAPPAVEIVYSSITAVLQDTADTVIIYVPVDACIVLIAIFSMALAASLVRFSISLRRLLIALNE